MIFPERGEKGGTKEKRMPGERRLGDDAARVSRGTRLRRQLDGGVQGGGRAMYLEPRSASH